VRSRVHLPANQDEGSGGPVQVPVVKISPFISFVSFSGIHFIFYELGTYLLF
jgi:hypothetical protein